MLPLLFLADGYLLTTNNTIMNHKVKNIYNLMITKAILILIAVLYISSFTKILAQQDPNYTFYRYNMNLINPAYAGSETDSETSSEFGLNIRSQWAGVAGAPETQSGFFSTKLGKNLGIGLSIINDQTFVENQTSISTDISYKLTLAENTHLFLGIKAGANSYNVNEEGLVTFGLGADPSLMGLDGGFTPNIGAGTYLKGQNYFVSFSIPRLLSPDRLEQNDGLARLGVSRIHMYFSAGYDILLGENTIFKPSTLFRYVDGAPISVDVTAAFALGKRFELAANYRIDEGVGGYFIFRATEDFDIGYAYEESIDSPVSVSSNGSHEIFIKFNL